MSTCRLISLKTKLGTAARSNLTRWSLGGNPHCSVLGAERIPVGRRVGSQVRTEAVRMLAGGSVLHCPESYRARLETEPVQSAAKFEVPTSKNTRWAMPLDFMCFQHKGTKVWHGQLPTWPQDTWKLQILLRSKQINKQKTPQNQSTKTPKKKNPQNKKTVKPPNQKIAQKFLLLSEHELFCQLLGLFCFSCSSVWYWSSCQI